MVYDFYTNDIPQNIKDNGTKTIVSNKKQDDELRKHHTLAKQQKYEGVQCIQQKQQSDDQKMQNSDNYGKNDQYEIQMIIKTLDKLDINEKIQALRIKEQQLNQKIDSEIQCIGCNMQTKTYKQNLIRIANQKKVQINLDGIIVNPEYLGINYQFVNENSKIASILHEHLHTENISCKLNQISKNEGAILKIKQSNQRCQLHQKKLMPNNDWLEILQNLGKSYKMNEIKDILLIDDQFFQEFMNNQLKRKNFCEQCTENIKNTYDQFKLMKSKDENSDENENNFKDDLTDDDDNNDDQDVANKEQEQENSQYDLFIVKGFKCLANQKNNDILQQCFHSNVIQIDVEKENLKDNIQIGQVNYKCVNHNHNNNKTESQLESLSNSIDLFHYIKFSSIQKQICLPFQMQILTNLLQISDKEQILSVKHANSHQSAQLEILICIGNLLKLNLQKYWINKKAEEMIRSYFLKIVNLTIMDSILKIIQIKDEKLGKQTQIEEYVERENQTKLNKKIKRLKKKQRQKDLKKPKSTTQLDSLQQQEILDQQIDQDTPEIYKEKLLLKQMGWQDDQASSESDVEIIINDNEIKNIKGDRAEFRKSLREKFNQYIKKDILY